MQREGGGQARVGGDFRGEGKRGGVPAERALLGGGRWWPQPGQSRSVPRAPWAPTAPRVRCPREREEPARGPAPPARPSRPGPALRCTGPAGRSVPHLAGPRRGHRRGSNRRPGGWQRGQRAPGHLRTQVSGGRAGAGRRGCGRGAERRGSRVKARKGPRGGRGTQSPRREDYWEGSRETRNVVPCS